MQKTYVAHGSQIVTLIAVLVLTACGGGGSDTGTATSTVGVGGPTPTATYTISWDPVTSSSTTVTGYRVYYGTASLSSGSMMGTIDTTTTSLDFVPGQHQIAAGQTLYMAVSALGSNGIESPASNTVSITVQ